MITGAANPPAPSLRSRANLFSVYDAVITSIFPSLLKSADVTDQGLMTVGKDLGGPNPPAPSPEITDIVRNSTLIAATSSFPSELKSPDVYWFVLRPIW